jgi:hypothetical protein
MSQIRPIVLWLLVLAVVAVAATPALARPESFLP